MRTLLKNRALSILLFAAAFCFGHIDSNAQVSHKRAFPYRDYQSVALHMKRSGDYMISAKDTKLLMLIINNSANFSHGEPDMPNIDGKIEFRDTYGKPVGSFTFDYYYGLLQFNPANGNSKEGLLTEKANRRFFALIKKITKDKL